MKMSTFAKGLIMAVIGFVASYISQTTTGINWPYLGIATSGFTLLYLGKNYLFPSVSIFGNFDLRDLLSGVFVAVAMAVSEFAASVITSSVINWKLLLITAGIAAGNYCLKTILGQTKDKSIESNL